MRERVFAHVRPGAIVKKITYEKSIDFCGKIIIIIIVRGKGRNRNNAWTQKHLSLDLASISEKHKKHKKDIDTTSKVCYNIIVKRNGKEQNKK